MVNWVKEAWHRLSEDVIIRSFETWGITTDDPDRIHCTKFGGIAAAARQAIQKDDEEENNDVEEEETDDVDDEDNNVEEIDV